ncbi:acyltransferase [Streptomyces sp. NPDC006460]|uniref:acyltransferase family protein n=1 Tax=Streptomyces sp. NPDC006460 TaxID=3154304 RepID=UPI0033A9EEFB
MDSLTGLRWFAALGVFLFHTKRYVSESAALTQLSWIGYEGVPFFFVLSGFVMAWVARPDDTTTGYYWRRFARIWPLLAVTTAGVAALRVWWWHQPVSAADVLWTLTFAQSWSSEHFFTLNVVTWTLSVEAFFYLAFPLLHRVLSRCPSRLLAVLAGLSVAATAATRILGPRYGFAPDVERLVVASPLSLTPMFVLGVCTAMLVRRGWRPPFGSGVALVLTAGTVLLCWLWFRHPDAVPYVEVRTGTFDAVLMPAFALLIATAALRDVRGEPSLLRSRPLVRLGEWSFAFYICHVIVLKVFEHLGTAPGPGLGRDLVQIAVVAVGTVAVAGCLHEWVEKPAERRLRPLLGARRAAV